MRWTMSCDWAALWNTSRKRVRNASKKLWENIVLGKWGWNAIFLHAIIGYQNSATQAIYNKDNSWLSPWLPAVPHVLFLFHLAIHTLNSPLYNTKWPQPQLLSVLGTQNVALHTVHSGSSLHWNRNATVHHGFRLSLMKVKIRKFAETKWT